VLVEISRFISMVLSCTGGEINLFQEKKIKTKKQQKKLSDMLGCKEKQTPKVWEYHQTSKQNRAWRLA
jgi:hypothetical protein